MLDGSAAKMCCKEHDVFQVSRRVSKKKSLGGKLSVEKHQRRFTTPANHLMWTWRNAVQLWRASVCEQSTCEANFLISGTHAVINNLRQITPCRRRKPRNSMNH